MHDLAEVVVEEVGDERPRTLDELREGAGDHEVLVDLPEYTFKTKPPGKDIQHGEDNKYDHVYNDQLHVPIVGPGERIFEFFEQGNKISLLKVNS